MKIIKRLVLCIVVIIFLSGCSVDYKLTIKDFIIGLKNNFLTLPVINGTTLFSLTRNTNHSLGTEYITGALWTCPIITILFFIPNFLKKTYKSNIKYFIF